MREESQATPVRVVTRPRTGWQRDGIATSGKGNRFLLSANHLHWGPLNPILRGNAVSFCGVKRLVCEAD